ncbi:MAG: SDR family NAD(P)-dependent oxidoreductase, partial [Bacteroides sp.]
MNKRIVIIGATSGIGNEVAKIYLQLGWKVGIAGRRQTKLEEFRVTAPKQIEIEALDVTEEDSSLKLQSLINKLGGMDVFLLSSGIGFQNAELKTDIEINTTKTNVEGFVRMTTTAFHYFETNGSGHLAVISSI